MRCGGLALLGAVILMAAGLGVQGAGAVSTHEDHPDPGESASFFLFPDHDDVMAAVEASTDHPWVTVHTVGESVEGREIRLLEITDPSSPVPLDERAVTFILTQQHGNEPAGTPAALDVLDEITSGGPLAETLGNQVLLLLPMANPDGAEDNQRHNAQDRDINRDHIGLETPEASVLHKVLRMWDVDVAMDHHEYGGIGTGNPSPVRAYDYDLTTLFPRHGNVRAPTLAAAESLMYHGIWPEAQQAGYSANEYGEVTAAGVPVDEIAGGPDPGIMRNHLGLHNIAGLLVETRVDSHPNPFHDAERRTDIHRVVMDATLRYVHEHAEMFVEAKRLSALESAKRPAARYLEGEHTGPLAPAYLVEDRAEVRDLLAAHGLPNGTSQAEGLLLDMVHGLQGHSAAVLHPASTRSVVDSVRPVYELDEALTEASLDREAGVPSLAPLLVLAFLALTALSRREG